MMRKGRRIRSECQLSRRLPRTQQRLFWRESGWRGRKHLPQYAANQPEGRKRERVRWRRSEGLKALLASGF